MPLACGLWRPAANFPRPDWENDTNGGTPSAARATRALPFPNCMVKV